MSIPFFFSFLFYYYLTLKWKQIIISNLHYYIHPSIKIGITKLFIPIQGEVGMERKFSLSFFIPIYQILSQRFETLNEVNVPRTFLLSKFRTWPQYDKISKVIYPSDGRKYLLQFCLSNRVWNDLLLKVQYLLSVVTVIFRPYLRTHQKVKKNQLSLMGCFSVKLKLNNGGEIQKPRSSHLGYENDLYIGVVWGLAI